VVLRESTAVLSAPCGGLVLAPGTCHALLDTPVCLRVPCAVGSGAEAGLACQLGLVRIVVGASCLCTTATTGTPLPCPQHERQPRLGPTLGAPQEILQDSRGGLRVPSKCRG